MPKIVSVLGGSCGKTSAITQLMFLVNQQPAPNEDAFIRNFDTKKEQIEFTMYLDDLIKDVRFIEVGSTVAFAVDENELFESIGDSQLIILMYCDSVTLTEIRQLHNDYLQKQTFKFMVVYNHYSPSPTEVTTLEEGRQFANLLGSDHYQISARTGSNISQLFDVVNTLLSVHNTTDFVPQPSLENSVSSVSSVPSDTYESFVTSSNCSNYAEGQLSEPVPTVAIIGGVGKTSILSQWKYACNSSTPPSRDKFLSNFKSIQQDICSTIEANEELAGINFIEIGSAVMDDDQEDAFSRIKNVSLVIVIYDHKHPKSIKRLEEMYQDLSAMSKCVIVCNSFSDTSETCDYGEEFARK